MSFENFRISLRRLFRRRLYCSVVVLGLGIGIGANVLCFSALYDLLLSPLPYPSGESLVWIGGISTPGQTKAGDVALSSGELWDLRDKRGVFEDLAAFRLPAARTAVIGGDPLAVQPILVTPNLSRVMGVAPYAGVGFQDLPPTSVLLSYDFWQEAYGGSLDAIGQNLVLDGKGCQIAGIMPKRFPLHPFLKPQIWFSLDLPRDLKGDRQAAYYLVVGRLAKDVTPEAASAALAAVSPVMAQKRPMTKEYRDAFHLEAIPLHERLVGDRRPLLLIFQLGAALLLVIVSMNIANLQLADLWERREQFAVCLSLGAPRKCVLAGLMNEGLVLALAGGVLAVLLSTWATSLLRALLWGDTLLDQGMLSPRTFFTATGAILVVLVVANLLPALRVVHDISPADSLKREQTSGRRSLRLMNVLVVLQVGCSLILLIVASVFIISWQRFDAFDPGFDAEGLVVAKVLTGSQDESGIVRGRLYAEVRRRLEDYPPVRATAVSSSVPIRGSRYSTYFYVETSGQRTQKVSSFFQKVSAGYFQLMEIPILAGSSPVEGGAHWKPQSVIVNEAFARRVGGSSAALGRRIQQLSQWMTIAAVVGNTVSLGLAEAPQPIVYGAGATGSYFLIRGDPSDENQISSLFRESVHSIDPLLPVEYLTQGGSLLSSELAKERSSALAFAFLGAVGLVVGFTALYGSVAIFVSERAKEIAIRAALGATPARIVRPIAVRASLLLACGSAVGLAGARILLRAAVLQWPEMTVPHGPHTILAAVVLVVTFLAGCYFPARRAIVMDPALTLKGD